MQKVQMCLNLNGRLANFNSWVARVPLDKNSSATITELSQYGNSAADQGCQSIEFDYENDEYLSKLEINYDSNTIRSMTITSSTGASITKGAQLSTGSNVSQEYTLDSQVVGFEGVTGNNFFQKLGGITVPKECYKGKVEATVDDGEKPVSDEDKQQQEADEASKAEDANIGLIVGVSCAGVIVLALAAVAIFCYYKYRMNKIDNQGTEVVAVTKTRPQTPPNDPQAKRKEKV